MRAGRGRALGGPLRHQEHRLVGLVPDRVHRHLGGELVTDRGHEFLEVLVVGTRYVRRLAVGGGPARRGAGYGQQHGPAEPLGFGEHRRVLAPVVGGRVRRFEARLARAVRARCDFVPVQLHAQRAHAEVLELSDHLRAGRGLRSVSAASKYVTWPCEASASWFRRWPPAQRRRPTRGAACGFWAWSLETPQRREGCGLCSVR